MTPISATNPTALPTVLGIDLGTTFCATATLDESGRPVTLANPFGDILTPTAILIEPDGFVVGSDALNAARARPELVATLIKRRIGYPDYGRLLGGIEYRPETLSAIVLRKLVDDLVPRIGVPAGVVITVPAYFDETRRKATRDAGEIAGLNVLDIIDEPTAAALAWSFRSFATADAKLTDRPRNVLVYDLGGGTFDVTIVRLMPKRFTVLAIEGDVQLGGHDFDARLVDHVAEEFLRKYGGDPRTDPVSRTELLLAAERTKRSLSKLESATITCHHAGQRLQMPISRAAFESMTSDLLMRTRLTTQKAMRTADLQWADLDRVLLVGGSTHMPAAARMLRELSGREVDASLAVSEVVAHGAAIHAGIVQARLRKRTDPDAIVPALLDDVVEITVNAHALGVQVRDGGVKLNDILIARNTQLPASASRVYKTTRDSQERVRVRVLQGEAHQAEACIPVGECWIESLPGDLPAGSPVQVRCAITASGLIEVMALDMTSGRIASAEIHRSGGLSDSEIDRERRWLSERKIV